MPHFRLGLVQDRVWLFGRSYLVVPAKSESHTLSLGDSRLFSSASCASSAKKTSILPLKGQGHGKTYLSGCCELTQYSIILPFDPCASGTQVFYWLGGIEVFCAQGKSTAFWSRRSRCRLQDAQQEYGDVGIHPLLPLLDSHISGALSRRLVRLFSASTPFSPYLSATRLVFNPFRGDRKT
jgi:hypothetical protein